MVKKYIYEAVRDGNYREAMELLAEVVSDLRITSPDSARELLRPHAKAKQESFYVITLNGAHRVIRKIEVTRGLVNKTMVHPREVFAPAILDRAAAIIVAHNHPSGNIEPSSEDKEITTRLSNAAEILGINILDHIIFGYSAVDLITHGDGFITYSMVEHGYRMS